MTKYVSAELEEALDTMDAFGLPVPPEPDSDMKDLKLPRLLSEAPMEELGNQLGQWASLSAYARYQVAQADGNRVAAEEKLGRERTSVMLQDTSATVTERKAAAGVNKRVEELAKIHRQTLMIYELLRALAEGYDKAYAAVSREISRREKMMEQLR